MSRRVALLFSGHLRQFNYKNLKENILDVLTVNNFQYDIFVSTWNQEGFRSNGFRGGINLNQILEHLNPKLIEIEQQNREYFLKEYASDRWHRGLSCPETSGDGAAMWYQAWKCKELCQKYSQSHQIAYDLVFRMRSDILYDSPLNPIWLDDCIKNESFYMPMSHGKYSEVTKTMMDHFFFAPPQMMYNILGIFPYLKLLQSSDRSSDLKYRDGTVNEDIIQRAESVSGEGFLYQRLIDLRLLTRLVRFTINYSVQRADKIEVIFYSDIKSELKVAILLCGNIRTWDKCRDSFNKTFKNYHPDLFIHCSSKKFDYHPFIISKLPEYTDVDVTPEDAQIVLQNIDKQISIVDMVIEDPNTITKPSFDSQMKDIYHGYYQYRHVYKAMQLMEEHECKIGYKYDIIIKTRFDLLYNESFTIDFPLNIKSVIIDSKNVNPNDWIIIGSRDALIKLPRFVINQYLCATSQLSATRPPHGLLEYFIQIYQLNVSAKNIGEIIR